MIVTGMTICKLAVLAKKENVLNTYLDDADDVQCGAR